MPFVVDTNPSSSRYQAWRAWRRLTAPPLVVALLIAVFTVVLGSFISVVAATAIPITGLIYVAAGIAAGLMLVFLFATTYYPCLPPEHPAPALRQRAAAAPTEPHALVSAASFELIHVLDHNISKQNVDTPALYTGLLDSGTGRELLTRLELPASEAAAFITEHIAPAFSFEQFADAALAEAETQGESLVELNHALVVLLTHPNAVPLLRQYKLNARDVRFAAAWVDALRDIARYRRRWWDPTRLLRVSGIGLNWAAGYTPLLDRFLRLPPAHPWDRLTASRYQYLKQVIATLARDQQANVLLVGHPGGGRFGIIQSLASAVTHNEAHPALHNLRVVYLHIGELLATGSGATGQQGILHQVLREIERAGNVIAVLDGLSSVLEGRPEQSTGLAELIRPFFSAPSIRTVTLLSPATYHSQFESREDLRNLFEVVQLPDATPETTLEVLAYAVPAIEREHGIIIPYDALRALVDETEGILQSVPYPERAFDVLDEVLVIAHERQLNLITRSLIQEHLRQKTGIPLGQLNDTERSGLLTLEDRMRQRVVNQRPAITAVVKALVRSRTEVRNRTRPVGTFLFLGPTGVGKTETTKTLAASYFGDEEAMVRFDMSEFQSDESVAALIGTPDRAGRLTSAIMDRPYTVVLLDELEKAHRSVHRLLLQVLDEGRATDGRGTTVSFRHSLIIATSNAGAEFIRQSLSHGALPADFDRQLREYLLQNEIFAPEFLNRFDGVITFTPLTPEHVRAVAQRMLAKLNQRLDDQHGIRLHITDELVDYVATIGYNPEFGARPLARAIQDTVEYAVARRLMAGTVPPGTELTLTRAELEAQARA